MTSEVGCCRDNAGTNGLGGGCSPSLNLLEALEALKHHH